MALVPGVGFTPLSTITSWKNHDGSVHLGQLIASSPLGSSAASIDARYGAGSSQRWYWTAIDNENAGHVGRNALVDLFKRGQLGNPTIYDGNPTAQEVEDACATGDPRVLQWAMEVPTDAEPVQFPLPDGYPCGVSVQKIPGTPYPPRPVLNTNPNCVANGAATPPAPPQPAPAPAPPPVPAPVPTAATHVLQLLPGFTAAISFVQNGETHSAVVGAPIPVGAGAAGGYFTFFEPGNPEVFVKLVDGRALNQKYWIFIGTLTDVEFTLTITGGTLGAWTYHNPHGHTLGYANTNTLA
jgi:hypothetical protein